MQPVDGSTSQGFGDNPTANLPADSWLIQTFGNYQPNGHTGIDYPVHEGTPVRAIAAGTVKHCGWYSGSYADNPYWIAPAFAGFVLVIDHGSFVGIYAHLSGSPVAAGEEVQAGQTVAYSGNTGGSTGPHLHFEVLPNGWDFNNGMYGRVNPASVLTPGLAAQGDIIQEEEDMPLTDEDAAKIAAHVWNFDYTRSNGNPGKPLWLLQSMDDIIRETIAKTAAATAQVILSTELPNVLTGGKTSLGLETSWDSYNVQALKDDQKPAGVSDAEFAAILREGIDKAVSGLSITLSAQKEN